MLLEGLVWWILCEFGELRVEVYLVLGEILSCDRYGEFFVLVVGNNGVVYGG